MISRINEPCNQWGEWAVENEVDRLQNNGYEVSKIEVIERAFFLFGRFVANIYYQKLK